MTFVKRLRLLTAGLGAAAACAVAVTAVLGDLRPKGATPASAVAAKPDAAAVTDELAKTRFTATPALAYTLPSGDTAFAWQLKPTLTAPAARPRDVLVMVDTSASQAGKPMQQAAKIVAAVSKELAAADRMDVWTANLDNADLTRSLSKGFQAPTDKAIAGAVEALTRDEYAAGAVDLKAALENATKAFERKAGRQRVVVYLGDGESAGSPAPLDEAARVELGRKLADRDVQFFAVPLGGTVAAANLHGLSMLTGGTVVRTGDSLGTAAGRTAFAQKLTAAIDVPVLRVDKATFAPAPAELVPGTLPPLRADRPALVLGTMKGAADAVSATVVGTVADKPVTVELTDRLPAADPQNYFLAAMLDQWRTAPAKAAPAVLAADRTLAMACEQYRLFRDEFVELGWQAITAKRLDHADKLFQAAAKIDPAMTEAKTGAAMVTQVRSGKTTVTDLKKRMDENVKAGRKLADLQDPPAKEPPVAGAKEPPAGDPVRPAVGAAAQAARAVADQEARGLVEETLRRVRTLRDADPDAAYEELKSQRDTVLTNDQLSDSVRGRLVRDLEASMRDVQVRSGEIKRRLNEQRDRISAARFRINEYDRQVQEAEQTEARIDRFRDLMSKARYELAYQEAQVLIQERINRGQPVPPEATATYRIGQSATNLREQVELRRIREDRVLVTLLQVEKSFIPYPDEPPVHFPPAQVWRELTRGRIEKYSAQSLGQNVPESLRRLQSILETQRVSFKDSLKGLVNLASLKEQIEKQFDIKIVVREDLFRMQDGGAGESILLRPFTTDANFSGMYLGSFLDVALLDLKASYIVRPEYIEITTMEQRIEEKVTRAFEVGDLALGIVDSVNQQALNQNLAVFGAQLQFFGQGVGAAQQFGQLGNGGQFNGGGGQFNGGGQVGGLAGGLGQMVGIAGGQQGGMFAQQGGQQNLGVGGGITGVTGGQLGQFGNLGGQFGIQGNDQSKILVQTIVELVARGEWANIQTGVNQTPRNPGDEEEAPTLAPKLLNSIGYYPPARALIIRGTSRYHPTQSFKLPIGGAGGGAAAPRANPNVLGRADDKPRVGDAVADPKEVVARNGRDPKRVWNETLDRAVTDPKLLVNAAEALFAMGQFENAAELLKSTLRHGHANADWAHEALALALQANKADPLEVERAAMSAVDLDPVDPTAYLKAAKAESDLGRADAAVALCRRAAAVDANMPAAYANALAYAEKAGDVKADVVSWAAENLIRRDWTNDGVDYPKETKARVERIAAKLTAADRKADADAVTKAVAADRTRDLMVELRWQGAADLDLGVTEPNGSVCDSARKRTLGGGVLKGDILEETDEGRSEVYTAVSGFSGTYTIRVTSALGRAIGGKAQLKVTKFAGTPKQEVEAYDVDLATGKPIQVALDGGSRTQMTTLRQEAETVARLTSTAAPKSSAPVGMGGGTGAANADLLGEANTSLAPANIAPLVARSVESRVPEISPAMPGLRVTGKVSADRTTVDYVAKPVFTGNAVDIPMPKVDLLPGGGR